MNFPIPSSPQVKLYRMQDFLGVDFSSSPASVDDRRSPNAYNFTHEDGQNVKRNGYGLVHAFVDGWDEPLGKINGMFSFGDILLVHVEKYLYALDGEMATMLVDGYSSVLPAKMADSRSFFINFNGQVIIFDGANVWRVSESEGTYTAETLSSVAYVPTTSIVRDGDGDPSTPYEPVNLITPKRINSFRNTKSRTTFTLDAYPIDDAPVVAYRLLSDGSWETYPEGIGSKTIAVDRTTGVVTFSGSIAVTPITGQDNVRIHFSTTTDDYVSRINKCRFAAAFGSSGNNNRLFASGNPDYPNTDWYCNLYDPTYWPDINYSQVGTPSSAIIGYTRVGNAQLGIHKETKLGDQGVYYRTGEYNDSFADDIFPVRAGYTDVEMLSMHTSSMLEGEPIFLSRLGVHAMIPRDSLTTTEYVLPNRSFYINNKLTQEANLENAHAITIEDRYYLAINNQIYVADGQYKYFDARTGKRSAQYEWYYWKDTPAVCLCEHEDTLYFGDAYGRVYRFVEGQYWDYDPAYPENRRPVELLWTCPMKSMNTISQRKTVRHTVAITQPYSMSKCTLGYIVDGIKSPIKEDEINVLQFYRIDFSNLSFRSASASRAIISKRSIPKFTFVQFYFESAEEIPAGLYAIEVQYVLAGRVRR